MSFCSRRTCTVGAHCGNRVCDRKPSATEAFETSTRGTGLRALLPIEQVCQSLLFCYSVLTYLFLYILFSYRRRSSMNMLARWLMLLQPSPEIRYDHTWLLWVVMLSANVVFQLCMSKFQFISFLCYRVEDQGRRPTWWWPQPTSPLMQRPWATLQGSSTTPVPRMRRFRYADW